MIGFSFEMKPKELLKSLIPERYRLFRYEVYERGRYLPELLFSLGRKFECPFCHWRFRRFRAAGFDYPVLKEKQVIGGGYRLNDLCPRCMSKSRERLLYLYLQNRTDLFSRNQTMLHIAPEPNLTKLLSGAGNIRYVSGDLSESDVMSHFDVMQMPFSDNTFDAVICNHVLEHVESDLCAMADLYRIMKPGGWAVLQVPIAVALTNTIEDPTVKTEQRRIELFGQRDHVRLYSKGDYVKRLESVGFVVDVQPFCKELPPADVRHYALISEELVFLCRKSISEKALE